MPLINISPNSKVTVNLTLLLSSRKHRILPPPKKHLPRTRLPETVQLLSMPHLRPPSSFIPDTAELTTSDRSDPAENSGAGPPSFFTPPRKEAPVVARPHSPALSLRSSRFWSALIRRSCYRNRSTQHFRVIANTRSTPCQADDAPVGESAASFCAPSENKSTVSQTVPWSPSASKTPFIDCFSTLPKSAPIAQYPATC